MAAVYRAHLRARPARRLRAVRGDRAPPQAWRRLRSSARSICQARSLILAAVGGDRFPDRRVMIGSAPSAVLSVAVATQPMPGATVQPGATFWPVRKNT